MQIQISWLLQKPTDLDLQLFAKAGQGLKKIHRQQKNIQNYPACKELKVDALATLDVIKSQEPQFCSKTVVLITTVYILHKIN